MSTKQFVYFFGQGKAEGEAKMKDLLGGKGANLAEMTNLGIPVPPGFTISTEVCRLFYEKNRKYPDDLEKAVQAGLERLETMMGKKLGDADDPLLVSVRSGAAISMPGMMDTILNLGMNDRAVEGLTVRTGNPRFAWDAYRRFIQMFGDVAMGVPSREFEAALSAIKSLKGAILDTELDAMDLQTLVAMYKMIYKRHTKSDFPQDPTVQLWGAINAVFGSWMNERAIKYRGLNHIKGLAGTAVNVQSMVFGNFGEDSGTGVCFTRDPSTGENQFYGEYLMNAQGEDVVAGIRTPEKLSTLADRNAQVYEQLVAIRAQLEQHYRDMQDMEFTVQQGTLYLLQTRGGKRTGYAAVKCAIDMVGEKLITKEEAVMRVTPEHIDQLLHPMIDPGLLKKTKPLTKGLNASPGAAAGIIVFSAREAEMEVNKGQKVVLVRQETSPEDISGMAVAEGILTSTGGMTSHAAVVARGMGTPCVSGANEVVFGGDGLTIGGQPFNRGDPITVDGTTGCVYPGILPLIAPQKITGYLSTFLGWCDEICGTSKRGSVKDFKVRANADQPVDARRAFEFGADGIGLCRTEHMFFDPQKLIHFRAMIVSATTEQRNAALENIIPLQQKDFFGIFQAMNGKPVTIRLLDPPLHEFIPHSLLEIEELAGYLQVPVEALKPRLEALHEVNPMLGHRGCRLAVTWPEIYNIQVKAISLAAAECIRQKIPVHPEVMIPIVCDPHEIEIIRKDTEAVMKQVFHEQNIDFSIRIGTMIEVPRAALLAGKIAEFADFFSFGTNDLTQMTFAFSRDDAGKFMSAYLSKNILENDPFKTLDEDGVGALIAMACDQARKVKPDLKLGICGEHGGDPATIDFCYRMGLNYVSCSPYRVPIARLAAAQAVLRNPGAKAA
ncbi:MAG: pyruvate, phosphate dikinase [Spirochaetaceae bacterium]|jgi:pyruvate,orthophosphate dikinase|nr:pyruvate, phosphate dikinase [Spirochaetaceae bacterium]